MIKLTKSEKHDPNYLAKVIKIVNTRRHSNADRLVCVNIDGNNVITGSNVEIGDIYVFFPPESAITEKFLSETNSYRDASLNADNTKQGFFERTGRVRVMMLRGEPSMGYIVPIESLSCLVGTDWEDFKNLVGEEFDTINGELLVKKYKIARTPGAPGSGTPKSRDPKHELVIPEQFRLHIKTTHLAKSIRMIEPDTIISVTDKLHGTSVVVGNVQIRKDFTWKEKLASWLGIQIPTTTYSVITSSRNVIKSIGLKNTAETDGYYNDPIHTRAGAKIGPFLNKGETVYAEIIGYTGTGKYIQGQYDYEIDSGDFVVAIYRITNTNDDGKVTELSMNQIQERALLLGVQAVPMLYCGSASGLVPKLKDQSLEEWQDLFLKYIETKYVEIGQCKYCKNKVPAEGVVVRIEKLIPTPFKMKQVSFVLKESAATDKGETNIETDE